MSNQLITLLGQWYEHKDATEWVLGSVYKTEGPCYRKAGAMMLFGGQGQQLGMLSGGCLESDIQKHARRVMHSGKALTLSYDGSDEDDLSFQLGIGCGGTVHIVLQPVSADNNYLELDKVYHSLKARRFGVYKQQIPANGFALPCSQFVADERIDKATCIDQSGEPWLHTPIVPQPHLLVVGGGLDARPLVSMATQLGWQVSLWDPRPANARREYFLSASHILREPVESLTEHVEKHSVNAAVMMAHHVGMDAEALGAVHSANAPSLRYLALLGPTNRRQKVLKHAGLTESDFAERPLSGPAGLDIGGELPEKHRAFDFVRGSCLFA